MVCTHRLVIVEVSILESPFVLTQRYVDIRIFLPTSHFLLYENNGEPTSNVVCSNRLWASQNGKSTLDMSFQHCPKSADIDMVTSNVA